MFFGQFSSASEAICQLFEPRILQRQLLYSMPGHIKRRFSHDHR